MDNNVVTEEISKSISIIYEIKKQKIKFLFSAVKTCEKDDTWKPLLLIVPLRLGLSEVNPIYINGLKKSFEIPGSVGMVGGRPNQAHYFIGYVGDEALYLDPHTTQKCGSIGEKMTPSEVEMDETYHQRYASRINFKSMDPSLALVRIDYYIWKTYSFIYQSNNSPHFCS